MTTKDYTVNELLEQLTKTELTRTTIEQYAEVIERERFLWEERLGATNALTSQLNGLVHFLLYRLPFIIAQDDSDSESWAISELNSYIETHLDDVVLSHEFVYASTHAILDSLRSVQLGAEVSI